MSAPRTAALVLALGLQAGASASSLAAQQVTFSGRADPEADRRIAGILAGSYRLLARDTTIGAHDTLIGPVLAVGVRLRLNGTVTGDLVGVASNLFVHPSAVVTGAVVNAGGGLYASSLAQVGDVVDRPLARYEVSRAGDTLHIQASREGRSPLALDGLRTFVPSYDRVDGLWLHAGGALRLPTLPQTDSIHLHGAVGWRTGGPGVTHTLDLEARRGRYTAAIGEQRLTATPDRWIRGDLANSLAFLAVGNDSRDYFDARRLFALLARDIDSGRWNGYAAIRLLREDADSLRTRDPFVFHKPDTLRPNPPMSGRITSASAEAAATWTGRTASYGLYAEVEAAGSALSGTASFRRYALEGHAQVEALWGHSLTVEARVQGPLPGTVSLPRQRWSHVGGPATLPTYAIDAFQGDRVVFFSEQYVIPLSRLKTPFGVAPEIALVHATGKAWSLDELRPPDRTLEQNLGVELRFFGLALSGYADPARTRATARFGAGFSLGAGRASSLPSHFDMATAER